MWQRLCIERTLITVSDGQQGQRNAKEGDVVTIWCAFGGRGLSHDVGHGGLQEEDIVKIGHWGGVISSAATCIGRATPSCDPNLAVSLETGVVKQKRRSRQRLDEIGRGDRSHHVTTFLAGVPCGDVT